MGELAHRDLTLAGSVLMSDEPYVRCTRRDCREVPRELIERMAPAVPQARPRKERPHTARRTVKAIGQDGPDPIRRLRLECRLLKRPIQLGKSRRTGGFGVAPEPQDTPTDNRGQIDLVRETTAVLLIRQELHRERQPTPGEPRAQLVVAERTDETIECHRREMIEHRIQLQAQAAMGGQPRIPSHFRSHLTRAQDEVREDRQHLSLSRLWYTGLLMQGGTTYGQSTVH